MQTFLRAVHALSAAGGAVQVGGVPQRRSFRRRLDDATAALMSSLPLQPAVRMQTAAAAEVRTRLLSRVSTSDQLAALI